MKNYIVISADVIDSKKHEVDNLRSFLLYGCSKFNSHIDSEEFGLITKINSSRGDEIQLVSNNFSKLPILIRYLRYYFHPLNLRIGIGIDTIHYFTKKELNSWNLNGQAFFKARQALDDLKYVKKTSTKFYIKDENLQLTINTIYELIDSIIHKWTGAKWDSIQAYYECLSYETAAHKLEKKPQSVQQNCSTANWTSVRNAEIYLSKILNNFYKNIR